MDDDPYDISGTDDDFPPSHQNRLPRAGCVAGNGRSAAIDCMPYTRMYAETDMEAQIHQLEQEAYSSVLRAFKAQADAITWEKESLITELRKELRLSNQEHRELSARVNSDDLIRRIREWRLVGGFHAGILAPAHALHDPMPSPTVSASRKKQKINQSMPSQSFGGPSPPFPPQPMAIFSQPSSSAAKRGPIMGAKGKKSKSGQTLPPEPLMRMQHPGPGPAGRGLLGNRGSSSVLASADGASFNHLIGRKVRTRWPDDNNFYEAVITDYNPTERRHALVYDIGTANETWEWADLAEISPEDIQWVGEDPGVSRQGPYSGSGCVNGISVAGEDGPPDGRDRGTTKAQTRKDFPPSQNGTRKYGSDEIQILHTDTLIKETIILIGLTCRTSDLSKFASIFAFEGLCLNLVFSGSHPDPLAVAKAKKVLKEHEQVLADAIARLAHFSDGESGINMLVLMS